MLWQDLEHMEFPGDLAVEGSVIGTAVAWVWSLAGELPHAAGMAKNKKQNETTPPPRDLEHKVTTDTGLRGALAQ